MRRGRIVGRTYLLYRHFDTRTYGKSGRGQNRGSRRASVCFNDIRIDVVHVDRVLAFMPAFMALFLRRASVPLAIGSSATGPAYQDFWRSPHWTH